MTDDLDRASGTALDAALLVALSLPELDDLAVSVSVSSPALPVDGSYRDHPALNPPALPRLVVERQILSRLAQAIARRLDAIKEALTTSFVLADLDAPVDPAPDADADAPPPPDVKAPVITLGPYQLRMVTRRAPARLNPAHLVELGVDPDLIAQATEPGRESRYVDVRLRPDVAKALKRHALDAQGGPAIGSALTARSKKGPRPR